MDYRKRIISDTSPYHISARSNNRDWFDLPMSEVWTIMSDQLFFIKHAYGVRIHSFVLMSNHFHMLATFPDGNLSKAMGYFMRETSRSLSKRTGRINHNYGGRYSAILVEGYNHFLANYKYIYRNPVTANVCDKVEQYNFSTMAIKLGREKGWIPFVEDTVLFDGKIEEVLKWLNTPPAFGNYEVMKVALRKKIFSFPSNKGRRQHSLENEPY